MIARPTWTVKTYLTSYDEYIFYRAIGEPLGIIYEPIAVAEKQGIQGTSYRFLCKATPTTYPPESFFAMVDVLQRFNGAPHVTAITELRA